MCSATRVCTQEKKEGLPILQKFQCPLELCVFCDYQPSNMCQTLYAGFSALSSFVCSATDRCEKTYAALYTMFQCPLELCVFCDTAEYGKVRLSKVWVSVPSRALCVLRPGRGDGADGTPDGFSALSSFVCSATLQPREGGTGCISQGFSALSSFVCSATQPKGLEYIVVPDWGFQCPLELCVFCDVERLYPCYSTIYGFSALSSFVCSATSVTNFSMAINDSFQCPLELCVFCDLY